MNNLRKLQYDNNTIDAPGPSEIYKHLQSVSSSLISEVNFTYQGDHATVDDFRVWNEIDNLMIQRFPALSLVTMIWMTNTRKVAWGYCVSQCTAALPKLHKKGILHPLLPPPYCLK